MIYIGIDVAKDKHDCFITNSEGEVLFAYFGFSTCGCFGLALATVFAIWLSARQSCIQFGTERWQSRSLN